MLLPWINRNLPSSQHPVEDLSDTSSLVQAEEASDGIKLSEKTVASLDNDSDKSTTTKNVLQTCRTFVKKDDDDRQESDIADAPGDENEELPPPTETDDALFCFRVLLVFNAALKSFAHGANDTANATGPFSAVLEIHDHGLDICSDDSRRSPIWIMVMAGVFVALGITTFGHKVITTVGEKLVVIDYHSGFCIELGSCVSVVLATQLGIPVSTTHCQVGGGMVVYKDGSI